MVKPEMIPTDAREAAWDAAMKAYGEGASMLDVILAAIAAALNAWPGMRDYTTIGKHSSGEWRQPIPSLILPLPETQNDRD